MADMAFAGIHQHYPVTIIELSLHSCTLALPYCFFALLHLALSLTYSIIFLLKQQSLHARDSNSKMPR